MGGPADKMLQFLKLCLKSISGHLGEKRGGVQYLAIFCQFLDFEIFYKCLTFQGVKKHFLNLPLWANFYNHTDLFLLVLLLLLL